MKVQVTINEADLREAIFDVNTARKANGNKIKLTTKQVKARIKNPEFLEALGEALVSQVVEELA